MAEDIVAGLFGITPQSIQEQRRLAAEKSIMDFQQLDPFQQAGTMMGLGGYGIGKAAATNLFGLVDPLEQQAQMRQAILSNLDPNDPESYLKVAKVAQDSGDVQTAMRLKIAANNMAAEQRKLEGELAKQKLAERKQAFQEDEALSLKKQALDNQLEIAKMRSEDTRLSAEQRAQAAKDANDTRLMIAQLMAENRRLSGANLSPGEKARDQAFGKDYAEYQASGGSADVEKQLQQLTSVSKELGKKGNDYTGPGKGAIPEVVRSFSNPEAVAAKNKVEEVAQRNLRLVLGAQFTQVEGERLIARAYNDNLSPEENKRRVDALIKQIRTAAQIKEDAARYFEEHGTLSGWNGRIPTLSDFEDAIDSASSENSMGKSNVKTWNPKTGKWEIK